MAMTKTILIMCALLAGPTLLPAQPASNGSSSAGSVLYENGFDKAQLGQVPDDMMVLDGAFAVKASDGNKYLELPGAPLEGYGVLFGPTETTNIAVTARIYGTNDRRRYPVFGVGLDGVGGFRLRISQAKELMELLQGDQVLAKVPYQWKSGTWTIMRLRVRRIADTAWQVEGKAWMEGTPEPNAWMISCNPKSKPPAGRASIWGSPFSGTPIRFDDLKVTRIEE